ncbi:MAG: GH3 auxin-responsive promoter family protein, partial [Cyclobacteriaceae bacterium]|nr:GH3 auxin-responsive promoter family protein [Cyclobacteriaceae bacterium]
MVLIGKLIRKGIKIRESLEQKYGNAFELQKQELMKLLIAARHTNFGSYHQFELILDKFGKDKQREFITSYRNNVPIHDYDSIFGQWWSLAREGGKNICWPGKVKHFALSSGTAGGSTKYIPVTREMLKSIKKTSVRQLLSLSQYNLEPAVFSKGVLMLGGSTNLKKMRSFYDADLSGITASNIPFWFQHFY